MNILVINTGSSSIKYQLFNMPGQQPLCSGLVERIGLENGVVTHKRFHENGEQELRREMRFADHEAGLTEIERLLTDAETGVISNPDDIEVVGHRVVHGGETFSATTIITGEVKEKIKELIPLAPLHNPANLTGIQVAEKIFNKAKQVGVFDTAFHQTMPPKAYRYAIPRALYTENGIRAYGFHGTSHKYVSEQAMKYLGNDAAKLVTIHLGNGCSMTAVNAGKSVDTTMGFGPLSGLVMGTRSGDIDASIIFHLIEQLGYTARQVSELLNKQSGMAGLAGYSDMRDITAGMEQGNADAVLAAGIYCYRIKKYIGAYAAVLNGLDAIVFTAGVGENSAVIRNMVCSEMEYLGLYPDAEKNELRTTGIREINSPGSPVKILVIPTNEELEIANQCYALLS
ncbi:MAG TPA: acetate kinase [Chitinophagaceae bacterium]